MTPTEIHITGDVVTIARAGDRVTVSLEEFLQRLGPAVSTPPSCGFFPDGVRAWVQRGDTVGIAVEVAPHERSVRWLRDDSPAAFGKGASYGEFFLAFPYVVLLLVFRRDGLTGFQQLYYRRAPLRHDDEELLLPNLYNVAHAYGQRCWVCLQHLDDVSRLAWPDKIRAVVNHVFTAAWNRSAEEHEGNSYGRRRDLDPRLRSAETWAAATRANPRFVLEVAWVPARTTVTAELTRMVHEVSGQTALADADDLAAVVARPARRRARA